MPNLDLSQPNIEEQIHPLLEANNYSAIVQVCELAIEEQTHISDWYWYLGLAYLLQGEEAEAQTSWLLGISQVGEDASQIELEHLSQILSNEAQRQQDILGNLESAWLIRHHLRELDPNNLNNLLHLVLATCELGKYDSDLLKEWEIPQKIIELDAGEINHQLLTDISIYILKMPGLYNRDFLSACLSKVSDKNTFVSSVLRLAIEMAHQLHHPDIAADMAEVCLEFYPDNLGILQHLSRFYSNSDKHQEAIAIANRFYDNCPNPISKVLGRYLILRALMSAGAWLEIPEYARLHQNSLAEIIETEEFISNRVDNISLLISPFFMPYLEDNLLVNRWFRNRVSKIFQNSLQNSLAPELRFIHNKDTLDKQKKIKIGYIASTLRRHSVGWLSRWLFHYHDRNCFDVHIYLINQTLDDSFTKKFFMDKANVTYTFPSEAAQIAAQIKEDEIDILVDLDSITLDTTCEVMAMKPAPIQVSWLGWDASGIPAIDYYIVDDLVLPENAQEHYTETLWRLPQTYVAVDGFEVGVPDITRELLNIPADAVTYLSAQRGYKRHPDTIKLQLKIIKEVPNSYFLVKGMADELTIQEYFNHLAEEVGVNPERLRFLPKAADELVHRANLTIADVVLDTYPYNGATTTLETLWMCIPMVTRVGEQFAARNSYTFMKNAGIEEGIAWTDEEYVEWGVRLGKDKALRWEIAGKMRESRQTSPLWNAKKFAQEMENAYRQMWAKYVEG